MKKSGVFKKLRLAQARGSFRTVDLFAGCGGMSLGFKRAGFDSIACVEVNDTARASHELNFGQSGTYRAFDDIRTTSPLEVSGHVRDLFSHEKDSVDVIIGGPPCQAFSRLGRAALWRLSGESHAHAHDERATYYLDFLRFVSTLKPTAFVMENVREIGKFAGRNIAEEVAITAEELGYRTRYALLNAVWFGVPQLRERMFIIGIHKDLGLEPSFPRIRFSYDLPVGYSTARAGSGSAEVLPPTDHYVDHFVMSRETKAAVTVTEAFSDLPRITHHLDGRTGKGFRRAVTDTSQYLHEPQNWFQKQMRCWPGYHSGPTFSGHVIRYTPRDYETFRRMPHGGMYPEAFETAMQIFKEKLEAHSRKTGTVAQQGDPVWLSLYEATVPPYRQDRYPNKFRKMWPDHPARTVPAHIGKDSYSHIHFDSEQARCISLREAARLQSFPDSFEFHGSMNAQLTQIGNAVPPLLAYAVADALRRTLRAGLK
jgi:DNA (cytosine-5)-methyltransferase 1